MPADLAEDFRRPGDFYTTVATRFLKRAPADKAERNRFKEIILSIVNGQGAPSLAKTLNCTEAEARDFLTDFDLAYPKVAAFKWLMYWQIAWTGETSTFMGRLRTVTAHRWLVTEPRVEILVSYRHGDAYWLDVVPLHPHLRVLTTYVFRAWNARTGRLIYDADRGALRVRGQEALPLTPIERPLDGQGGMPTRRLPARVVIQPTGDVKGQHLGGNERPVASTKLVEIELVLSVGFRVVVSVTVVEEQVTKQHSREFRGRRQERRLSDHEFVKGVEDRRRWLPLAVYLLRGCRVFGMATEEVLLAVEFDVPGGLGGTEPRLWLTHRVNLP
jgi:hypothetical protein